ncbi:MAG: hypothetical protein A2104_03370 [Candidatus Melainabacteria bacterium GWF2_32_7]|nr:MAG: hypothetical protein A2104_03370 [Candidatus Melainabacteria bacterium GWF2_32_7]
MLDKDSYLNQPCAICGENRPEKFRIWFDDYVKLYCCNKCGFISQFPGPGKYTVIKANEYKDKYSLDFVKKGKEFMYPQRENSLQDIINRITKYKTTGDLLDIGCGDGHFLSLIRKEKFNCYGVEASEVLSNYASSKSGAKIIQNSYNKELFPPNSFDIITLLQVLEHIHTPVDILKIIKYHLRPNGILVVEIPSINSPHFLAYRLTKIKKFVKPPKGVIYSHFGYYSPKSLLTLTQKSSFKKEKLITGRWQHKYSGYLKLLGFIIDPILNLTNIGGIFYIGSNIK